LQVHADLRGGEPGAVGGAHGVLQVVDQRMQLLGVELAHRLGDAQQPRVAHLQYLTHGHAASIA
jgi:hypothetical protein